MLIVLQSCLFCQSAEKTLFRINFLRPAEAPPVLLWATIQVLLKKVGVYWWLPWNKWQHYTFKWRLLLPNINNKNQTKFTSSNNILSSAYQQDFTLELSLLNLISWTSLSLALSRLISSWMLNTAWFACIFVFTMKKWCQQIFYSSPEVMLWH